VNFSLFTNAPSKKNWTHLTVISSHRAGVLTKVASMFKAHVGKSDKSTTGARSVTLGGETDESRIL
jgi:hypothetical protein